MTIEELVDWQSRALVGDEHVVHIGEEKWTVAHTDDERAEGFGALIECPINDWLEEFKTPPAPMGIYLAFPDEKAEWVLIHVEGT